MATEPFAMMAIMIASAIGIVVMACAIWLLPIISRRETVKRWKAQTREFDLRLGRADEQLWGVICRARKRQQTAENRG